MNKALIALVVSFLVVCGNLGYIDRCFSQSSSNDDPALPSEPLIEFLPVPSTTVIPENPRTGRIILNGRLLLPPYEVFIDSASVSVNGINVWAKPAPRKSFKPDANMIMKYSADTTFRSLFIRWYNDHGIDSARVLSCFYYISLSFVDTAFFVHHNELCVRYLAERYPVYVPLDPPDDNMPSREEVQAEMNQYLAVSLINQLNVGCLVIRSGGYCNVTHPPQAKDKLESIMNILEADLRDSVQIKRLLIHISDEKTADSIVHYFNELAD